MKVRICIIGNGPFASRTHYPSLVSFDDVEIVGICAFNEEHLIQTAHTFNIPEGRIYVSKSITGYQGMLKELQPDGVYVIGQPGFMLHIWVWCLENKFNLFIEKPLGITLHQARMLAHLADENGCITQVSFQRRSSPILGRMRDACLEKGSITHAAVEFSKHDIAPMFGERDRMLDDFTHIVDTARWVCGGEVVEIQSRCRSVIVPDTNLIVASLFFDNGSSCFAFGNWSSGRRIFRVHMHAPGICVEVEPEKGGSVYVDGDVVGVGYDSKVVAGSVEFHVYGGFQKKNREFIDSISNGREETSSPFRDALKTMEVCETILAQALVRKA